MNINIKFILSNILILTWLLFSIKSQAQINVDLELRIDYPVNGQVIPFGDTAHIEMSIINHSSNDIINDTLLIDSDVLFGSGFIGDILAGDTVTAYGIMQWMGDEDTANVTMDICYYFRNPVSFSNRVADTNAANDTACVSYVLLGNPNTGIATPNINGTLKLSPNPASGLVNIQLDNYDYHQLRLSVTDVLGRGVLFHNYEAKSLQGKHGIQFDVTSFQSGVYFVRLVADGRAFTTKLVVQ